MQSTDQDNQGRQLSPFERLSRDLDEDFAHIKAAQQRSKKKRSELQVVCDEIELPEGLVIVAFGSLARDEWTSGSDIDWTLLIDAPATPGHFQILQEVTRRFEGKKLIKPGTTGFFGGLANSHELIHHIGGQEDTNQNLTRRILLLLESCALTDSLPLDRVIRQILRRYIVCDPGVSSFDNKLRVPRFLLNDIIRYWRTVAVDYATKKWQQDGTKWALRNIKLRMSRKLLYVKGLLTCFDCELNPLEPALSEDVEADIVEGRLLERIFGLCRMSPMDVLCQTLFRRADGATSVKILSSYDKFLQILDNEETRGTLAKLNFEAASGNKIFQEIRQTSHSFRDGLECFFFDEDSALEKITRTYGVF